MARGAERFYETKRLVEQGLNDYAIARLTGVPRPTVQRWRHRTVPPGGRYAVQPTEWRIIDAESYCYLLGDYLGDGNLVHRPPNRWTLRVACDRCYALRYGVDLSGPQIAAVTGLSVANVRRIRLRSLRRLRAELGRTSWRT